MMTLGRKSVDRTRQHDDIIERVGSMQEKKKKTFLECLKYLKKETFVAWSTQLKLL